MTFLVALLALAHQDGGATFYDAFEGLPGDAGVSAGWLEPALKVEAGGGLEADGGWTWLGPGCFLPSAACLEKGKAGAELEAEVKELRGRPHDFGFSELVKAGWVGFGLGILTGLIGVGFLCWAVTGSVICRGG